MDLIVSGSAINHRQGSKYTDQDRRYAAVVFALYGNSRKVSEVTGIPQNTLVTWFQQQWWIDLINNVQEENKQQLNANFSRLIDKSVKLIEKQLDNDEVKALDAAKIMGISFDKRQILNNQPTSITKSSKISDLQEEFERYINAKEIKTEDQKLS